MPRIDVGGIGIVYDIVGNGPRCAAITPGGRFSKDAGGIRELAERIAAGGFRVLIWDRPNCGESDISVTGPSESVQNADTLAGLLRALDFGPALLVGGSGGARETLLTTVRHPDLVERAFVLWLSGGAVGIATLPSFYCADAIVAATHGGMAEVAALPGWQEPLTRNPGNRDRLLALDPAAFIATMTTWAEAYFPHGEVPVPLLSRDDLAAIRVPVTVLRSGASDMHHCRATSEAIAGMIPGATLAEPPWGDREWVERLTANLKGEAPLFGRWPLLAPMVLEFAGGGVGFGRYDAVPIPVRAELVEAPSLFQRLIYAVSTFIRSMRAIVLFPSPRTCSGVHLAAFDPLCSWIAELAAR